MELVDTVELMNSEDYKDRFKAEYHQTKIRHDKLEAIVNGMKNNTLDFKPDSSLNILEIQLSAMECYLKSLIYRAIVEEISLD